MCVKKYLVLLENDEMQPNVRGWLLINFQGGILVDLTNICQVKNVEKQFDVVDVNKYLFTV